MIALSIEDFGAHLLTTGDLDPVYSALNKCAFEPAVRNRWLAAYCAFYNCGFASYASEREAEEFWSLCSKAAENTVSTPYGGRWPRASERRHFRGEQAIKAIDDWFRRWRGEPENMMTYIAEGAPSFEQVAARAKEHRSVGNWLSFKIVDLVDACMAKDIDQSNVMLFMYEAPRKSLLNLWREKYGFPPATYPKDEEAVILGMVQHYHEKFRNCECPHKPGKPVDMFCLETIFCKYQSHLNGRYPLYNDIDEINHGLLDWLPYSENARLFLEKMPKHA